MMYVGIDPGASGGIAAIDSRRGVAVVKMPVSDRDLLDILETLDEPAHCALEHVWSIPGQGGAFAFGGEVRRVQMALTASGIPYDLVLPRRWQAALGVVYPKGATDTEKKNITKRRAAMLFPALTITHATADALLLAEYCRRVRAGVDGGQRRRKQ